MYKLLAVFGNPVLHSKSPLMLNALLGSDGLYTRIRANSGKDVAEAIRQLNLVGANITAPFKEDILPFVDEISDEVRIIGGTNTIANENGVLKAFNTDWFGATEAIKRGGLSLMGLKTILLGLGGAGKAVAYGLVKEGAEVTLINRTESKAVEVAQKLGCRWASMDALPALLKQNQLFVSAVIPSFIPDGLGSLPRNIWVFDANYHASKIADLARSNGNKIIDASQWLLYQAIKSHEYYLKSTPNEKTMAEALKQAPSQKITVLAICSTPSVQKVNEELTAIPRNDATNQIQHKQPDLVIYTPNLSINEVEEIYQDERNKALGH